MSETNPLITNLKGRKEPGTLIVTFVSGVKGSADIQYYSPSHHTPWQHSVKRYDKAIPVLPGMSVRYPIGVGKDTDWRIRVTVEVDEYTSTEVIVPMEEEDDDHVETDPSDKKLSLFTALWYDNNVPDNEFKRLMTSGHHAGPNKEPLQKVLDYGHRLIPTVGGFQPSDTNYQLRQKVRNREATFRSLGFDNIDAIIYRDEPHAKGFTVEQLETIVDEGKKVYGEGVRATFPFTINAVLKKKLPSNLNTVWINGYPFFKKGSKEGYAKIFDFTSFREYMNNLYNTAKQKVPGADIIVTAQVFGTVTDDEPPWRIPEPETAEWYMRVIAEHPEIVGLTFWADEPTDDQWVGLGKLPELKQAWITAIKKWVK